MAKITRGFTPMGDRCRRDDCASPLLVEEMIGEAPKMLNEPYHREIARRMRDDQWAFADKVARLGTVWVCWWDKDARHCVRSENRGWQCRDDLPEDLVVHGLIGGMELLEWLNSHPDWWSIGEWSDARYATPVTITAIGRSALTRRELYDMEPVTGGLVGPGWQSIPTERGA